MEYLYSAIAVLGVLAIPEETLVWSTWGGVPHKCPGYLALLHTKCGLSSNTVVDPAAATDKGYWLRRSL